MTNPFIQDTAAAQIVGPIQTDSLEAALEQATDQLIDSIETGVGRIADAMPSPSIWEVGASLAAIMVAVLAVIEMVRIYLNRKEGQKRAAARVSAVAIPVRRQIKSWFAELPSDVVQMEEQLEGQGQTWSHQDAKAVLAMWNIWNTRSARSQIREAERRIEDMNAEAPLASEETGRKVVRATAEFYGAFDELNEIMALAWDVPLTGDLMTHATRERGLILSRGHQRLRRCIEELDLLIDERFGQPANS